jgi:hypothetical protein
VWHMASGHKADAAVLHVLSVTDSVTACMRVAGSIECTQNI